MFANAFQSGFLTLFYSIGSNPLSIWDKTVKNGHIRRIVDEEVKSLVLEIAGTNVATTYITCPIKPRASLGVRLPFLVMVVKNLKKYFTFEIQILDDKDIRRRFRVSNFQSTTKVRPFCTTMPIGLSSGWNQIQFNLADFTKRAYGTTYVETVRVQIHANVRLRRIYFSSRLYSEEELPNEYRMFLPGTTAKKPETTPSKLKQETLAKKESIMKDIPPEPTAAPPSPVEEEREEQAQPSPVDESTAPISDFNTAEASEFAETEREKENVEEVIVPAETPTEDDKPPVEGAELGQEVVEAAEVTEGVEVAEGDEAPESPPVQEGEAETAPVEEEDGEGEAEVNAVDAE